MHQQAGVTQNARVRHYVGLDGTPGPVLAERASPLDRSVSGILCGARLELNAETRSGLPGAQGSDPREYGKQYEVKLRQAELESIEDYIVESKNLTVLHEQVRRGTRCPSS